MRNQSSTWRYTAEDSSGVVVAGTIVAEDSQAVERELSSRQLLPLSIDPSVLTLVGRINLPSKSQTLSLKDLSSLCERLSDLLNAGIPIAHALHLACEQAQSDRERTFTGQLLAAVRSGQSLLDATRQSDYAVPKLFSALVEAGEILGTLDRQMARLATHYHGALALRREIVAQLLYPAALVILIIGTLVFLSFFVLPQFEAIFATSGLLAPAETRFVITGGAFIRNNVLAIPASLVAVALCLRLLAMRFALQVERVYLRTPFAGRVFNYTQSGRYLRTFATLMEGGAPMLRALTMARQTVSSRLLGDEFEEVEGAVRIGDSLSSALGRLTSMPAELVSFIEIGEQTGEIARLSAQAASRAEAFVRTTIQGVMAIVAPVLTAFMGLVTAGVIAAVMTGVLSLNDAVF